jgi:hypothetical protein
MASYVRQAGTEAEAESPYPVPEERIDEAREILQARVAFVDPDEEHRTMDVFERRASEWRQWDRTDWQRRGRDGDIPLLRRAGDYASGEEKQLSWATPNSLRDVDAECELKITTLYLRDEESANGEGSGG